MEEYKAKIIEMIENIDKEDVIKYIYIIMSDIYKEVCEYEE